MEAASTSSVGDFPGVTLYTNQCDLRGAALEIVCDLLNIKYHKKEVNLFAGEHKQPQFLKINPYGQVPVLIDNGLKLTESRAIMTYLVEKYGGEENQLYPRGSLAIRTRILTILYFDIGHLHPIIADYVHPQIFYHINYPLSPPDPVKQQKLDKTVALIKDELKNSNGYLVTDHLTLADISVYCTFYLAAMVDYDFSKFPNVDSWMMKVKATFPSNETFFRGMREYKDSLKKNASM